MITLINKEKLNQLENRLKDEKIDALVIATRNNSDNALSLFADFDVLEQAVFIFDSMGKHVVITNDDKEDRYANFQVLIENGDIYNRTAAFIEKNNYQKIALNISEKDYLADGLTIGQYLGLEEAIGKQAFEALWCSSEDIIGDLRAVKSETEIEKIKKAVKITTDIYDDVYKKIKIGMSETQIADLFVEGLKKYGVVNALGKSDYAYPLVMVNRCGLSHREPMPGYYFLEGDILVCDFSIKYQGYCSDIARGFYALRKNEKSAPSDVQKAFDTAVNAVSNVIENISVGMRGCDVDWLGRQIIEDAGYPTIRHSCGHQLGTCVHDGGTPLSPYDESKPETLKTIRCNEVYAIEPTVIQDDGLPSFIVEENIVVREYGAEVLSKRQTKLWLVG